MKANHPKYLLGNSELTKQIDTNATLSSPTEVPFIKLSPRNHPNVNNPQPLSTSTKTVRKTPRQIDISPPKARPASIESPKAILSESSSEIDTISEKHRSQTMRERKISKETVNSASKTLRPGSYRTAINVDKVRFSSLIFSCKEKTSSSPSD